MRSFWVLDCRTFAKHPSHAKMAALLCSDGMYGGHHENETKTGAKAAKFTGRSPTCAYVSPALAVLSLSNKC